MAENTDLLLLNLIKLNDEVAFKALFYKYAEALERFVLSYTGDRQVSKEIVIDIFTFIWEHRQTINITNPKSYLFTSAKNKSFNYIRRKKTPLYIEEMKLFDVEASVGHNAESEELADLVAKACMILPERCKEIYIQSRERNLSNKQIAKFLDISEKTVENQITKAIKKIRQYLEIQYNIKPHV